MYAAVLHVYLECALILCVLYMLVIGDVDDWVTFDKLGRCIPLKNIQTLPSVADPGIPEPGRGPCAVDFWGLWTVLMYGTFTHTLCFFYSESAE